MTAKQKIAVARRYYIRNYLWYDGFLFLVSLALLVLLLTLKIEHAGFGHWFLFSYTVLLTVFQLFRLRAAVTSSQVLSFIEYGSEGSSNFEPMVSIVVPCKNEEKEISHTLRQCFAAEYPKEKLEVIVINDGSTDGTLREIRGIEREHPELIVINWQENRGKREGMAAGFRIAKGDIVVQLDSDSYIEPSKFRHLIRPFRNSMIAAVCAHADVANAGENFITKMQAGYYFVAFRILKAAESSLCSVFCCSGCSSAYRKEVILPILDAWLNEKFMGVRVRHGDDRSLTGWVLRQGYRTVYTHKAQAYTIVPATIRQLVKQQVRWKKSWISNAYFTFQYIFKTDPFVGLFYFTPLVLISFLTPIVALANVYIVSAMHRSLPLEYLLGGFIVTLLYMLYAIRYARGKKKYIGYFMAWQFLTVSIFSYLIFYSLLTFRNQRWGTR